MQKSQSKSEKSQISRTLAVLNKIGQSLIDVQDQSKVLNRIAKDAKTVLGADIVDLYEYNQARKEFVLPPIMVGKRRSPHISKEKIYDDDVVVRVVKIGKPQYFLDAQSTKDLTGKFNVPRTDAPDERFVIREGVASSVLLPLQTGKEIVGAMFVNYRTQQKFDAEQKNLIESFSNLAAIAIHNARLWEAQKKQTKINEGIYAEHSRQLNTIEEIVNAIGATPDPLPIILQQVVGLFVSDYGAIGLFIPQTKEVKFYAIWEEGTLLTGDDIPVDKRSISGKKSIMFHVATTGQACRISDVRKDLHYKKWYSKTLSELAVPLKDSHGNVIGVLNLESTSLAAFTQTDEDLCQGLANVISSVIEKSNLLSITQKLNRQLELLHGVVGEQDLQIVLTHVLEAFNEVGGVGTSSSINLYDEENDSFYSVFTIGEHADNLQAPPRPDGMCRHVVNTRMPLYIEDAVNDLNNPPSDRPTIRKEAVVEDGVRSYAALPLIRNERVLGVLFVHQTNQIGFTQNVKLILNTFANQAAIAIDNARRALDITALQEINDAIVSKPLQEILNLVTAKAAQVVGADHCELWQEDPESGDLILQALYCPSGKVAEPRPYRIKVGTPSVNLEVFQAGKHKIISDIHEESRYLPIYLAGLSELTVPMKYRGKTIGTLNVESDKSGAFSEYSALTLDTFAEQAAIAIISAQTYEQRAKDIAALEEVNSAIGKKDLSEIYGLIAQKAEEITGATYSTLWVLDSEKKCLRVGAVYGRETPEEILALDDTSINGHVATTRQAHLCQDTSTDPYYHSWFSDIRANLTVPMVFKNKLIGTLHVESTQKDAFTEHQQKIMQSLANQAAVAIENSCLYEELEERVRRLTKLQKVAYTIVAGGFDQDKILSLIANSLIEIFKDASCVIRLFDSSKKEFGRSVVAGVLEKQVNYPPRSDGTSWFIVRNPKPRYIEDAATEPADGGPAINQTIIEQGVKAAVHLPLITGDKVIGILYVNIANPYTFSKNDRMTLELFANQAAIAIENAQLYEQRNNDIAALEEINKAVVTEELPEIIQRITKKAAVILSSEYGGIWLLDSKTGDLVLQASSNTEGVDTSNRIEPGKSSINRKVYADRKSYICPDVNSDPNYYRIYPEAMSSVTSPLIYRDEVIGTINVESSKLNAFEDRDVKLLESFANQAAISIENAQSYTALKEAENKIHELYEQRNNDIAALQEINKAVVTDKLPEIIRLITKKAVDILSSEYGEIWLLDSKTGDLVLQASTNTEYVGAINRIEPGKSSINRKVYADRKSYICPDANSDPNYYRVYTEGMSSVTSPLFYRDEVIGTINVESSKLNAFENRDVKLLESFANQAAISIQIARKNENLNAIIKLGKDLTTSIDLNETQVLHMIYEKLDPLMNTENMYIALYDRATDMVRFPLMFVDGKATKVLERKAGSGRTEHVIDTKAPLFIATRNESIAWYEQAGREEYIAEPFASWIGVPMISGDQVIGVIATYHKTDDYVYDQDDLETLQAIANQAAMALEITRRIAELKALQGLTNDLSAGLL